MLCPQCNKTVENDAVFCGNCGTSLTSHQSRDLATISDKTVPDISTNNNNASPVNSGYGSPRSQGIAPQAAFVQTPPRLPDTSRHKDTPLLPSRPARNNSRRNILIVLLLLLLVAGGTVGITFFLKNNNSNTFSTSGTPTGQVAFLDNQNGSPGHTDALKIAVEGLSTPASGFQYNAWLINDQSEQVIPLGTLIKNGQKFSLSFTGSPGRRQQNSNLLGLGNRIEITLEQGQVSLPTGKVILSGTFPPRAFIHIRHLLFSFPTTPGNIGLLVGLMNQAQALNAQALVLQNIAANGNQTAIQCAAQSIIDISEGIDGPHYHPLAAECASQNITQMGDGFGILGQGYVATAAAHASLAATQPDSTNNIRLHAGHVEIATNNIQGWVTTVDQDALKLLANPSDTSVIQEIVNLSDHAYHGIDTNGDEQIDPVAGEAGAITAYIHGQLMAGLPLTSNG